MHMYNYNEDFITVSDRLSFSFDEMDELYSCIEEILNHDKWKEMTTCKHHLDSKAIHLLEVCCVSWRKAKKIKNCDASSVAIGALLHDFFFYDWQKEKVNLETLSIKRKIYTTKMHGFLHPLIAFDNAHKFFPHLINKKIEDIIIKHMWPLTINPPRCREAWIVCMADKRCSLNVLKSPKELPKYLGIPIKNNS